MSATWAIARCMKRRPGPPASLIAATAFVVFCVGFNAPRLLRNATYYSYLSHTPRYYEVIRDGRYSELFSVAKLLRDLCPPERRIALLGDDVSVIHYLTERRVVRSSTEGADSLDAQDVSAAVVDMTEEPDQLGRLVRLALEQSERFERVYEGERWHVYRRIGPPAAPDARKAGPDVTGSGENGLVEGDLSDART